MCWNEFISKANDKNVIKNGGWVKLCWNDFLSKSNKKVTKHVGVVRFCWNEFLSKVNYKNIIKSGEFGQIMLE